GYSEQVVIEWVELHILPPIDCRTSDPMTGRLSEAMVLDSSITLPLAAYLDNTMGSNAAGTWQVEVRVRTDDGETLIERKSIEVVISTARSLGEIVTSLMFTLPILAVGGLGIGFGIGGAPEKLIPEGVLWFAFIGGLAAILIARAILASKAETAVTPFLAVPVGLLLFAAAGLSLYTTILQPDFLPLQLNFITPHLQSPLSIADEDYIRQQLMGLAGATVLAIAAGGIFSRREVTGSLQGEIGLTTFAITCLILNLGYVADTYARSSELHIPPMEILLPGFVGLVCIFYTVGRPIWTKSPAVTLFAGSIPVAVGVAGLLNGSGEIGSAANPETLTSIAMLAWGGMITYFGGRNLLARLVSGHVMINITPNPVRIGGRLSAQVQVVPLPGVRIDGVTARLQCERHELRYVDGEQRSDTIRLLNERKRVNAPVPVNSGEPVEAEVWFVIPLGSIPTQSGSQGVFWRLAVTVNFAGRPDHAEEFDVQVLP
ncbi:MAG: hypothetical protein AB7H80_18070, partial [Candidatus Kapaibacterium sp.]